MNGFILNIAAGLFLSEIASAVAPVDEAAVIAKVNGKVNAVITDTTIQPTVDGLVDGVVELGFAAIKDEADLKALLSDAVSGQWTAAMSQLKLLMAKALPSLPQTPVMAELEAILGQVYA